jgi:SAM-dependent methyltransferase
MLIAEGFVGAANDEPGATTQFLDVACGCGSLSMELIKRLVELDAAEIDRYKFLVTDVDKEAVRFAEKKLQRLCKDNKLSSSFIDCFVMDGCHPTVQPNSISFLGCMFGIMHFSELDAALPNLLATLQPGGVAVFGTWKEGDCAAVMEAFGRFLGVGAAEAYAEATQRDVPIGESCDDMVERLSRAGFVDVRVEERTLIWDTDSMSYFQSDIRDSVLDFNGYAGGEEALLLAWQRFCRDSVQCPWSRNDGSKLQMRTTANLSIARKPHALDSV